MEEPLKPTSDGALEFDEKIPTSAKVAYGFANAGNGLLSGLGLGAINLFYLKATAIEPSMMAISWIVFAVWNAINDPLLGILEDKTKSKLGRRIPYLRYGSIFYVLAFIMIWFPFTDKPTMLFWNHLLMLFVFDTLYSMIGLITYSLPAEMALTAKERGSIILYATFIGAIGLIGSILIPIMFLGDVPNISGFRITMFVIAIVAGLMIYLSSYYIKENRYAQHEETLGLIDSIKMTMKNKPFLILEIGIFAMTIMQNILTGYLLFVTDYVIEFNLSKWQNILIIALLVPVLIFFILRFTNLIAKYGLKKVFIIGCCIGIFGFAVLLVMGLAIQPTAANKLPLAVGIIPVLLIILGLFSYMFCGQPLMADAIDNDELITGKRRETSYSGVNALITKPAVSIGHALFLWIIQIYGYSNRIDPETGVTLAPIDQPPEVALGVIIAFTLIPMVCLAIAVFSMRYFNLDGPEWMKKKQYIHNVHIEKEKAFLEKLQQEQALEKSHPK